MTAVEQRAKAIEIEAAQAELATAEASLGKTSSELTPLLEQLAALYYRDGLYAKAELLYRRCVDILKDGQDIKGTLDALSRLGMLYLCEDKLDDAEAVYLRLCQAAEGAGGQLMKARTSACLAGVHLRRKQFAPAEELLQQAASAYAQALGERCIYLRLCLIAKACMCQRQGKTQQADEFFERSRQDSNDAASAENEQLALLEVIQAYYAQGRLNEVEELLSGSILSDVERLSPLHRRVAQALRTRAELFRAQGRFADAERQFKRALEIAKTTCGQTDPEVALNAFSLAQMYLSCHRLADAEQALKLSLKARVVSFGVSSPGVAACIETYAVVLKRTKRNMLSSKFEARARDIRLQLSMQYDRSV